MRWRLTTMALIAGLAPAAHAQRPPDLFAGLYRTLVETDTTLASGSCTRAADNMARAMADHGFPAADLHSYGVPDHPEEGGLVAILRGADPSASAVLLVAHIDVVDAVAAQWTHPPFALTEQGGYFHGRGTSDNKAVAAALIAILIDLNAGGARPKRTVKIALTCGEESADAFNGAAHLARERRDLIAAGIAFVPSGGAMPDSAGRPVSLTIQAGEKAQQNFRLEAIGTSSHGSRPAGDNAITLLAMALARIGHHLFPVEWNPVTRRYFAQEMADAAPRDAEAIADLLADPSDPAAQAIVTANPAWNGMLRTTCVATTLQSGQQANSIAARASANINCRLMPGTGVSAVQNLLTSLLPDHGVTIAPLAPHATTAPAPLLTPDILRPVTTIAQSVWPGVRLLPAMLTGTTDARHFSAVGIPTYGLTIFFDDPGGNNVHAANERIPVRSVQEGRVFLQKLIGHFANRDDAE